jgi:hypothetical protein
MTTARVAFPDTAEALAVTVPGQYAIAVRVDTPLSQAGALLILLSSPMGEDNHAMDAILRALSTGGALASLETEGTISLGPVTVTVKMNATSAAGVQSGDASVAAPSPAPPPGADVAGKAPLL